MRHTKLHYNTTENHFAFWHIKLFFAARVLYEGKSKLSPKKAAELADNIYQNTHRH